MIPQPAPGSASGGAANALSIMKLFGPEGGAFVTAAERELTRGRCEAQVVG